MTSNAKTVKEYLDQLPTERKTAFLKLRKTILKNLPKGFEEVLSYGMIGYVIPHSIYPSGYHCNPELPLSFAHLANQKNSINFYHSGIYADKKISDWFKNEYPKHTDQKLDMGKSCVRFKKMDEIPNELIGELMTKISVQDYIKIYDKNVTNRVKK